MRKSALNTAEFFNSEQRWLGGNQSWSVLKQRWPALMYFIFFESELKTGKFLEKCNSAPINFGSSTRIRIALCLQSNFQ